MASPDLRGLPSNHVIGYIRVSSSDQIEGYSLPQQDARIREFARANGLTLIQVFADPGRSGRSITKRPALMSALRLVQGGGIGGLIVVREDRLSRRTTDSFQISGLLFQHHTALIALEPFQVTTGNQDAGSLDVRGLMQILAQEETDRLRQRVEPSLVAAATRGVRGGHAPPGYLRLSKEHWTIDPILGPVIKDLFRHVAEEDWSPYRCFRSLQERSVLRSDGKPLSLEQVIYLLKSTWYIGEMTWTVPREQRAQHGTAVVRTNHHPALIDAALFQQVQAALAAQAHAAACGVRGGHAPLGYQLSAGTWSIDPRLGPEIAGLFHKVATEQWSAYRCQRFLRERGVRRSDDKIISLEQITTLLRNPWYTGRLLREGSPPSGNATTKIHPALVDEALFQRVQAALAALQAKTSRGPHPAPVAAVITDVSSAKASKSNSSLADSLQGPPSLQHVLDREANDSRGHGIVPPNVAVCPCGGTVYCTLHTLGPPGHRYKVAKYTCERRRRLGTTACPERPVPMDVVDRLVEERLFAAIAAGSLVHGPTPVLPPNLSDFERQIAAVELRISRLEQVLAQAAPGDRDRLQPRWEAAQAEVTELRQRRDREQTSGGKPLGPLAAFVSDPVRIWRTATVQARRRLVASTMREVVIADKTVRNIEWIDERAADSARTAPLTPPGPREPSHDR